MSYDRLMHQIAQGETLDSGAIATNTWTLVLTDAVLLEHLVARYTSQATVGNRTVVLEILDANNAVLAAMAGDVTQAASLTRSYVFGRGLPADAAFVGTTLQRPTHLYRLEAGWKIRVRDSANIAAGDSLRVLATARRIRSTI